MINTEMTQRAERLMLEKHKNQLDKAGEPYCNHPLHVAEQMEDEVTTVVALLHDIVEDSDIAFEDLERMHFPEDVIEALIYLTHRPDIDYFDYIEKIGENEIARKVKIKDLEHNMDLMRLKTITEKDLRRYEKYKRSRDYLLSLEGGQL